MWWWKLDIAATVDSYMSIRHCSEILTDYEDIIARSSKLLSFVPFTSLSSCCHCPPTPIFVVL